MYLLRFQFYFNYPLFLLSREAKTASIFLPLLQGFPCSLPAGLSFGHIYNMPPQKFACDILPNIAISNSDYSLQDLRLYFGENICISPNLLHSSNSYASNFESNIGYLECRKIFHISNFCSISFIYMNLRGNFYYSKDYCN